MRQVSFSVSNLVKPSLLKWILAVVVQNLNSMQCNADASAEVPPLVVQKYKNPHYFKNF
jgi:hypothetical protein